MGVPSFFVHHSQPDLHVAVQPSPVLVEWYKSHARSRSAGTHLPAGAGPGGAGVGGGGAGVGIVAQPASFKQLLQPSAWVMYFEQHEAHFAGNTVLQFVWQHWLAHAPVVLMCARSTVERLMSMGKFIGGAAAAGWNQQR